MALEPGTRSRFVFSMVCLTPLMGEVGYFIDRAHGAFMICSMQILQTALTALVPALWRVRRNQQAALQGPPAPLVVGPLVYLGLLLLGATAYLVGDALGNHQAARVAGLVAVALGVALWATFGVVRRRRSVA